jgi:hypothetical protein
MLTLTDPEFARKKLLASVARELLDSEGFREIIKDLKEDAIRRWNESQSADKREDCWRDLQAVGRLENHLKTLGPAYRAEVQKIENFDRAQQRMRAQQEAANRG